MRQQCFVKWEKNCSLRSRCYIMFTQAFSATLVSIHRLKRTKVNATQGCEFEPSIEYRQTSLSSAFLSANSHMKYFQSIYVFLSANSAFAVQISGIYLSRITRHTCLLIFGSILTTFDASFIFWGSWGSIKNWLELKIEPSLANLACLNWWNTL